MSKQKIACWTALIFLILSAVYLPFAAVLQTRTDEMQRGEILTEEENLADVTKTIMSQKTSRLVSDLLYISDTLRLSETDGDYAALKNDWIAFADRKKVYDQIRYLDAEGNEVIRVNFSASGSFAVPEGQLQNKGDRYYFQDTIALGQDQIYISKMDLNVEGDKVEDPIKPMIRLSTPVYGADGALRGIVILNYYANDILGQVRKVSSTSLGSVSLLNSSGYWLYNSEDSTKEWAFMYDGRQNDSFAAAYPQEWADMAENNAGNFATENGFFNYTRVFAENDVFAGETGYTLVLGDGDYFIVSHIAADTDNGRVFLRGWLGSTLYAIERGALVFLLLLLLSGLLAFYFVIKRGERAQIRYFSEYDTMTGILNRRAGLERLQKMFAEARKTGQALSFCFLDINGLKEVNDRCGHERGDELILSVAEAVKSCIRGADFLARLGGDEFLVVFEGLDEAQAESVWQRIEARIAAINDTAGRPYLVSVSHGIETVRGGAQDGIDAVLNRADEKMYAEKREVKKTLRVLRE